MAPGTRSNTRCQTSTDPAVIGLAHWVTAGDDPQPCIQTTKELR